MQLLHKHKILPVIVKDLTMNASLLKEASSDNFEVKEKRSSDASLRLMNPVASGDNVTNLNSTHKLKVESPPLVPCCEGRELQINEELVRSGLSAISVRHDSVVHCLSMSRACERMQVPPGLVKLRNSFRSLHRPDLKRVPYLRRMTLDELETLFRGYADLPRDRKEESARVMLPPDANVRTGYLKSKEAINLEDGQHMINTGVLPTTRREDLVTAPCNFTAIYDPSNRNTAMETLLGVEIDETQVSQTTVSGSAVNPLHPISERRSGADVPAGMRLHGARARLYTSVLAGARAGDQLDAVSTNEEYDMRVPEDTVPENQIQLTEELQIILPPRCDDVTADSSVTTSNDCTS